MSISMNELLIAADWLDCNEGDEIEAAACSNAAAFLRKEFSRRDHAGNVRVAKRFGTTPDYVKEMLTKGNFYKDRGAP